MMTFFFDSPFPAIDTATVWGWAIGNVTDVDTAREMLVIDGRPAGFDAFEVPFALVSRISATMVRSIWPRSVTRSTLSVGPTIATPTAWRASAAI